MQRCLLLRSNDVHNPGYLWFRCPLSFPTLATIILKNSRWRPDKTSAGRLLSCLGPKGTWCPSSLRTVFLPSIAASKGDCALYITPIPVLEDLDAAFLFTSATYAEQVTYYFDGTFSAEPPIDAARYWEYAARHLPKVGIAGKKRLRLGIAHTSSYDLADINFSNLG